MAVRAFAIDPKVGGWCHPWVETLLFSKLLHFLENICSWVENEHYNPCTVDIQNVNFKTQIFMQPESVFKTWDSKCMIVVAQLVEQSLKFDNVIIKWLPPSRYWAYDCLSMLGFKSIHASKGDPRGISRTPDLQSNVFWRANVITIALINPYNGGSVLIPTNYTNKMYIAESRNVQPYNLCSEWFWFISQF